MAMEESRRTRLADVKSFVISRVNQHGYCVVKIRGLLRSVGNTTVHQKEWFYIRQILSDEGMYIVQESPETEMVTQDPLRVGKLKNLYSRLNHFVSLEEIKAVLVRELIYFRVEYPNEFDLHTVLNDWVEADSEERFAPYFTEEQLAKLVNYVLTLEIEGVEIPDGITIGLCDQ